MTDLARREVEKGSRDKSGVKSSDESNVRVPVPILMLTLLVAGELAATPATAWEFHCAWDHIKARVQGLRTFLSDDEATAFLIELQEDPRLPRFCPAEGCNDRAHYVAKRLEERKIFSQKIFVEEVEHHRGLSAPDPFDPDRPHHWGHHVANLVSAAAPDGTRRLVVLDPWLAPRLLTIPEWLTLLGRPAAPRKSYSSDALGWFVTPRFVETGRPPREYPRDWEDHWKWIQLRLEKEAAIEKSRIRRGEPGTVPRR